MIGKTTFWGVLALLIITIAIIWLMISQEMELNAQEPPRIVIGLDFAQSNQYLNTSDFTPPPVVEEVVEVEVAEETPIEVVAQLDLTDYRALVVPYEQELAMSIWDDPQQAQALSNILDNERYDRNPWCSPESDGSCAYGLAQKIDGWDDSYRPGDWQQQVQWTIEYIRFSSHGYGDPITAWKVKQATGAY